MVTLLRGCSIVAQDPHRTYLGTIDSKYAADSVFNRYGDFGSIYSQKSIWNKYGDFGSRYSEYSPFNPYSIQPPMLISGGRVVAYLSTNRYASLDTPVVDPAVLLSLRDGV